MQTSKTLSEIEEFDQKKNTAIAKKEKELERKSASLREMEEDYTELEKGYLVDLNGKAEREMDKIKPQLSLLRQEVDEITRQIGIMRNNKFHLTDEKANKIKKEYEDYTKEYEALYLEMEKAKEKFQKSITKLVDKHIENKLAKGKIISIVQQNCEKEDYKKVRNLNPMVDFDYDYKRSVRELNSTVNEANSKVPYSGTI